MSDALIKKIRSQKWTCDYKEGVAELKRLSELPATPCSARWQSCALWPDSGTSSDEHDTKAQASAACRMLKRDGMGGLQEVFPTKTWVVPPKDEP